MANAKQNVYDIVTNRIIDLITNSNKLVWQRSWQGNLAPMNYVSKKPYRGFNRMLCSHLFDNPYFMTFNQIRKAGGKIIKGQKSVPIIYWNWLYLDANGKKVKDEKDAVKKLPFLRYFNVFNATQIEGIDFVYPKIEKVSEKKRIEKCEAVVKNLQDNKGLKIDNEGKGRAFYRPSSDSVHLPLFKTFKSSEAYYSVMFHELVHWTGHSKRLNRELDTKLCSFGDTDYSKEELVAEMGASFICEELQIANEQTNINSAAYLKGWLGALKSDTKMLVQAGAKAQKAVDYILE